MLCYENKAKFLSLKSLEISLNIQNGGANIGHVKSLQTIITLLFNDRF